MACDICGKTGCYLESLNTQYQTDKIKDICSDCSRMVNDQLWEIRKINQNFLQKAVISFMKNKRENLATGNT
jgi:hypothetical protein